MEGEGSEDNLSTEKELQQIFSSIKALSQLIHQQRKTLKHIEEQLEELTEKFALTQKRVFRGKDHPKLSRSHRRTLLILKRGPEKKIGAWELAKKLGLSRGRASEILNELWKLNRLKKSREKRKVKFQYMEDCG